LILKYPLFKVHLNSEETLANLESVFASGYLNEGEQVIELEKKLSQFLEINNLTLVNSGTSAITLALRIIGVGVGDEVITTAMTCIATNTPIVNSGAKIVWADIYADTGMISVEDVESKITPRTKAIMIVDWAGTPADLVAFENLSKKFSIPIIQDAAHAFGAKYDDIPISNFADFTCFSFQAIKHFTTGDGGGLVCRNINDFSLARKLKWFGYDRDSVKDSKGEWRGQKWDADILENEVGYKFNMNNMSAAVGLANLSKMTDVLQRHRTNAALLTKLLSNQEKIKILDVDPKAESSFWVYTLRLNVTENQRDSILQRLNGRGIGAGLVHLPNDRYTAFHGFRAELTQTHLFASTQISLPCGWWLSQDDIQIIASAVIDEIDAVVN
jgi:perosamine synthetase